MSRYFFEKPIDGLISDIDPKKLKSPQKPDFALIDRFSEQIFREKGWNENLDFGIVQLDDLTDILGLSNILSSISLAIEELDNFQTLLSNENDREDKISKTQEQFQGYFVEEIERRIGVELPKTMKQQWQIQNIAENIKENTNPLNILTSGDINAILNIFRNDNETTLEDVQAEVDSVMKEIWDINNALEENLLIYQNNIEQVRNSVLENNRVNVKALDEGFQELILVFNASLYNQAGTNLYSQCISVKDIMYKITDNYRLASVNDPNVSILEEAINTVIQSRDELNNLASRNKRLLSSIEANYSLIHPNYNAREQVSTIPFKINETFFVEDDKFEILYSLFYKDSRDSYKIAGHSSVNKDSTTFIKNTRSRKDYITEVDESVPTNHSSAIKYSGSGDKIAESDQIETVDVNQKVGPIQDSTFDELLECIAEDRDYSTIGENKHLGRYGFSANILIDYGYVKQGTSTKNLSNDQNWLGRLGIESQDDFLNGAEALQNNIMEREARRLYKSMLNTQLITKRDPIDQVGAAIVTAYKFGINSVKNIVQEKEFVSGNQRNALTYYQEAKSKISNTIPETDVTKSVRDEGGSDEDVLEALSSSNTISDTPSFYMPPTGSAYDYPYNSVTETESGHYIERDDTPGAERLNERHRTGTGYEIMPDGSRKLIVISDAYKAVFGDDYIMVTGNCNISCFSDVSIKARGDVDIESGGDINLNSAGDLVMNAGGDLITTSQGARVDISKGDRIENTEGFYSSNTEGDAQIEAASLSLVARENDIDIASPQNIRQRANNVQMIGKDSVAIASENEIINSTSVYQISADSYAAVTDNYNVDGGSMMLKSSGDIRATVTGAAIARARGTPPPVTGSVAVNDSAISSLEQFVEDPNMITDIEDFEAFDRGLTQAYTNDSSRSLTYYSVQ